MGRTLKTTVVNRHYQDFDVDISRTSKWGNPFVIGRDGNRTEVITKYLEWLVEWVTNGKEIEINGFNNRWVCEHVHELKGNRLGCWCVHGSVDFVRVDVVCHGEILMELAESC